MYFKFEYNNDDERNKLVELNTDKYLIEEQNITEGNFLIFSDSPIYQEVKVVVKESDLNNIIQQQTLIKKAIDDIILGGAL